VADKQREWTVPADLNQRIANRDLYPLDETETQQAFFEAASIAHRVGGVVRSATLRAELHPDRWATVGYYFLWESYAQPLRYHDLYPEPEQEPEEDPMAMEPLSPVEAS
jgi:hypothetical protein